MLLIEGDSQSRERPGALAKRRSGSLELKEGLLKQGCQIRGLRFDLPCLHPDLQIGEHYAE